MKNESRYHCPKCKINTQLIQCPSCGLIFTEIHISKEKRREIGQTHPWSGSENLTEVGFLPCNQQQNDRKMKIRPLHAFSNFVVENLPEALESPSVAFVEQSERFLREFSQNLTLAECIIGVGALDIALLDLKMLESGIVHSNFTPPQQLVELIDTLSTDRIPALSYEDLIFINPLHDLRLFTRGAIGETEKAFYLAHGLIESSLSQVIAWVTEYLEEARQVRRSFGGHYLSLTCQYKSLGLEKVKLIAEQLTVVIETLAGLAHMPQGHFATFRKYLNSHPIRNLKGPSGAFTARIPVLELLFRGNELPKNYTDYLEENEKYFPRDGQRQLRLARNVVQERQTVVENWQRKQWWREGSELIKILGTFFDRFRKIHFGAVARQIPESLKGTLPGTGGESNPGEFLKRRMEETKFGK